MLSFERTWAQVSDKGTPTADLAQELLSQLEGQNPALVGIFAPTSAPLAETLAQLQSAFPQTTVIGNTTAGQFTDFGEHHDQVTAWALAGDLCAHAHLANGLKADPAAAVERVTAGAAERSPSYPYRTAIVLLDGLAGAGEEVTLLLSGRLGGEVKLAGGAVADQLAMQKTWVGTGDRIAEDALLVVYLDTASSLGIGVDHGHRALSGPLAVTRASGNQVHEVEHTPAWQVWLDQTRARARELGTDVDVLNTPDEIIDFFGRFEAGLHVGDGFKMRAPLTVSEDGALSFACGVPEGTVIRVMETTFDEQIDSAARAARAAAARLGGSEQLAGAVVFECACRKMVLGDQFNRGIEALHRGLGELPLAGFEGYGEVAMDPEATSGFHNSTSVVLAFPAS